jgi:hypothetical protein
MATITSTKDGLWSDATVWGGIAPVAGDTINVRHKIIMDLNDNGATPVEYGRINVESNQTVYSTGTAKAAGTTVTGSGTAWTSAHVNQFIVFDCGHVSKITAATNGTTLTIADSIDTEGVFTQYFITSYYGQLIHADGDTAFACKMFLYVNGGRYEMKPGSKLRFKGTSKSSSTEGGRVGLEANGGAHGTYVIAKGSLPMPETTLTSNVYVGDYILPVADATQFAAGEYIAVYNDYNDNMFQPWGGQAQSDEGFIVHHISGNNLYIQQRVAIEDTLAQNMPIGATAAFVNNVMKWQPGIKLYIDDEVFKISAIDESLNKLTFESASTVVHNSGAIIVEAGCQKTYNDIMQGTYGPNTNNIYTHNPYHFKVGDSILIGDETATITSIEYNNRRIYFTPNITKAHGMNEVIRIAGTNVLSHKSGDKIYKIATVLTANSAQSSTTITVANAAMLDVGDRIVIEGDIRNNNRETETTITAKNGNALTLATGLVRPANAGFIVTKTNRDCVITVVDPTIDASRAFVYYYYGGYSAIGRGFIFRYAELSHVSNSSSSLYAGLVVRGEFYPSNNKWSQKRELRGCVVRDGWGVDCGGINAADFHYGILRNNVVVKCHNGLRMSSTNGSSVFNNISIGNTSSSYRYEGALYYNQFQYNIGLNNQYACLYYSDYNAYFPETHNIFKHIERGVYAANACTSAQYGSWIKNRFNDVYFRHQLVEGIRAVYQDAEITYASDATWGNLGSAYANADERGLNGGMLILVNKDFIRGNFEMHGVGGIVQRDNAIHMGNNWSYKYTVNNNGADNRISQMIYVKYGVPVKVVAYMRKNSAYNGVFRPRIIAQGKYLGFIYQEMENINDRWVKVELNFTPPRSEMIEVGVGGRGTAGNCWVDPRVRITTFDVPLINGPYSVNLMFGLEQIYDDNPNVVLGNTKVGGI